MTRYYSTLTVFAFVAFWAGAQSTAPEPRPDERARQFELNRGMIESLIDGSLKISESRSALAKSASYGEILDKMKSEIQKASNARENERLQELTRHLGTILKEGLVPNLVSARKDIAAGSQDEKTLFGVRDAVGVIVKSLDNLAASAEMTEIRKITGQMMNDVK